MGDHDVEQPNALMSAILQTTRGGRVKGGVTLLTASRLESGFGASAQSQPLLAAHLRSSAQAVMRYSSLLGLHTTMVTTYPSTGGLHALTTNNTEHAEGFCPKSSAYVKAEEDGEAELNTMKVTMKAAIEGEKASLKRKYEAACSKLDEKLRVQFSLESSESIVSGLVVDCFGLSHSPLTWPPEKTPGFLSRGKKLDTHWKRQWNLQGKNKLKLKYLLEIVTDVRDDYVNGLAIAYNQSLADKWKEDALKAGFPKHTTPFNPAYNPDDDESGPAYMLAQKFIVLPSGILDLLAALPQAEGEEHGRATKPLIIEPVASEDAKKRAENARSHRSGSKSKSKQQTSGGGEEEEEEEEGGDEEEEEEGGDEEEEGEGKKSKKQKKQSS